jgi:hypothetical protein
MVNLRPRITAAADIPGSAKSAIGSACSAVGAVLRGHDAAVTSSARCSLNQLASAGSYGHAVHAAAIVHVILLAGRAALTVARPRRVAPGACQPTA